MHDMVFLNQGRETERVEDLPYLPPLRLFQIGETLVKVATRHTTMFALQLGGPISTSVQPQPSEAVAPMTLSEADRTTTRLEIQAFYLSVKENMLQMEHIFVARELDAHGKTIRPKQSGTFSLGDLSLASTPSTERSGSLFWQSDDGTEDTASVAPTDDQPSALLARMRTSLRADEFGLYEMLKAAEHDHVNDVRKAFSDVARSAKNRLAVWSRKHLEKSELRQLGRLRFDEPEYFAQNKHSFPGSPFLVREDEPLSIIAYSLSSRDFQSELSQHPKPTATTSADILEWRSGVSAVPASSGSRFSSQSYSSRGGARPIDWSKLDPDRDEVFYEPEPVNAIVKRKQRHAEGSILSLRLRRTASSLSAARMFKMHGEAMSSSVEKQAATVQVEAPAPSPLEGICNDTDATSEDTASTLTDAQDTASVIAASTVVVDVPPRPASADPSSSQQIRLTPSSLNAIWSIGAGMAPADASFVGLSASPDVKPSRQSTLAVDEHQPAPHGKAIPGGGGRKSQRASPHIKHTLFHGATKVSCVSWFAEEFAALRERWGVSLDGFAESLSRCHSWAASGGKSRSAFYKTADGRFIAKQLVTVWSVDEKEAFLEFAPSYIKHMMRAAKSGEEDEESGAPPSLLVRIAGVYSIKVKDTKSGETRLKMNVMVQENLFADLEEEGPNKPIKPIRFDLKGIRDRRVKQHSYAQDPHAHVWWDGEWIDRELSSPIRCLSSCH